MSGKVQSKTFNVYLEAKGLQAPANMQGSITKHSNGNVTFRISARKSIKNLKKALEKLEWIYEKEDEDKDK